MPEAIPTTSRIRMARSYACRRRKSRAASLVEFAVPQPVAWPVGAGVVAVASVHPVLATAPVEEVALGSALDLLVALVANQQVAARRAADREHVELLLDIDLIAFGSHVRDDVSDTRDIANHDGKA